MNNRNKNIVVGLVFIMLLVATVAMQPHLKKTPQILMLLFAGLTLLSFLIKNNPVSATLFNIFIGIMLFISIFTLTNIVVDIVYPGRGWIQTGGIPRRVMDMTWIWRIITGFIFSAFFLYLYHRLKLRNRNMEIGLTAAFILSMTIIYIIF